MTTESTPTVLRRQAEDQFAEELAALAKDDDRQRPPNWKLSPWGVAQYILGGKVEHGLEITPKYIGNRRLVEIAIATLATDRALLLLGVPGTAKTWLSEHLAAAISGDSTLLVQGTAGTAEETIRYGWNYALLLAKGPSPPPRTSLLLGTQLKLAGVNCSVAFGINEFCTARGRSQKIDRENSPPSSQTTHFSMREDRGASEPGAQLAVASARNREDVCVAGRAARPARHPIRTGARGRASESALYQELMNKLGGYIDISANHSGELAALASFLN